MGPVAQIALGTLLLSVSAILHVGAVSFSIPLFAKLAARMPPGKRPRLRIVAFLSLTVLVIVLAHTLQIWIWAASFLFMGELQDLPTSFYFATVTYTTLGYGDIVLGPGGRIVATFCSIAGLLAFGLSTAFLIGVLARIMPDVFSDAKN